MITITSLVKTRGNAAILDDLSLTVARGEVAVIIGPSGGGKSTLLRCINALEPFQGGSVTVEDITLIPESSGRPARREVLELRRKVGMVFQQFNLFPHMSILANVTAGPLYALGTPRAEAEVRGASCSKGLGWRTRRKPGRPSFRGDSNSVLQLPVLWRLIPRRSCSTSRRAPSIPRWPTRFLA